MVLSPLTTKIKWRHIAQWWYSPKAEPTCLYCDCTSFTECSDYCMTCLNLGQYVICVMSTRVQSITLPLFYMKITLIFWIPFIHMHHS